MGAYDHSLLIYTFGKSTLAPGERLGYIALSPAMPRGDREAMRENAHFNHYRVDFEHKI